VTTLQLIDVPLDADVANPQGRPLGTREQLARRLAELLPGTQFDAEGRGVFRRGSYDVAFKMYGDPPTSLGVAFQQPEAFTAIARLLEKTNWCLIDPERKAFVDIAASRAAGRVVVLGDESFDVADPQLAVATTPVSGIVTAAASVVAVPAKLRNALPARTRMLIAALSGLTDRVGRTVVCEPADRRTARRQAADLDPGRPEARFRHRMERYEDRVRRRASLQ
jgi:hypothetical protein